jgi:hypothetical protein
MYRPTERTMVCRVLFALGFLLFTPLLGFSRADAGDDTDFDASDLESYLEGLDDRGEGLYAAEKYFGGFPSAEALYKSDVRQEYEDALEFTEGSQVVSTSQNKKQIKHHVRYWFYRCSVCGQQAGMFKYTAAEEPARIVGIRLVSYEKLIAAEKERRKAAEEERSKAAKERRSKQPHKPGRSSRGPHERRYLLLRDGGGPWWSHVKKHAVNHSEPYDPDKHHVADRKRAEKAKAFVPRLKEAATGSQEMADRTRDAMKLAVEWQLRDKLQFKKVGSEGDYTLDVGGRTIGNNMQLVSYMQRKYPENHEFALHYMTLSKRLNQTQRDIAAAAEGGAVARFLMPGADEVEKQVATFNRMHDTMVDTLLTRGLREDLVRTCSDFKKNQKSVARLAAEIGEDPDLSLVDKAVLTDTLKAEFDRPLKTVFEDLKKPGEPVVDEEAVRNLCKMVGEVVAEEEAESWNGPSLPTTESAKEIPRPPPPEPEPEPELELKPLPEIIDGLYQRGFRTPMQQYITPRLKENHRKEAERRRKLKLFPLNHTGPR